MNTLTEHELHMLAYEYYKKNREEKLKSEYPEHTKDEMEKIISKEWEELSEKDKEIYINNNILKQIQTANEEL